MELLQLTTQVSAPSGEALVRQDLLINHARNFKKGAVVLDRTSSVKSAHQQSLRAKTAATLMNDSQPSNGGHSAQLRSDVDPAFQALRSHFIKVSLCNTLGMTCCAADSAWPVYFVERCTL